MDSHSDEDKDLLLVVVVVVDDDSVVGEPNRRPSTFIILVNSGMIIHSRTIRCGCIVSRIYMNCDCCFGCLVQYFVSIRFKFYVVAGQTNAIHSEFRSTSSMIDFMECEMLEGDKEKVR